MKLIIHFLILILIVGCSKEEIPLVDYCPGCTCSVQINGQEWVAKPEYADYWLRDGFDTTFNVEIWEVNSSHDRYDDALILYFIPVQNGKYRLDSFDLSQFRIDAKLLVHEVEYGTPGDEYYVVRDGNSFIKVEYFDRNTGEFKLTFNLTLSVEGGVNGQVYNSTYPSLIHFENGIVEGRILTE